MSPSANDEAFLAHLADYLNEWGEFAIEQDDFTATSGPFLLLDTEPPSNIGENAAIATQPTEQNVVDQHQTDKKANAAKRKLKYANKMKNEKKLLREQVRHLSAELNELQKSKKKFKVLDEKFAELPVWMAVALRQEQGRREAEEQQQRLMSAVVKRDKLIRDFEKEVNEKVDEGRDLPTPDDIPADIALFEEYLQDMDDMYSQTDAVFYPFGLEESPLVPYREGPNWRSIGGLQYAEFLDILPIPFTFEQTCTVMWKSILQTHGREGRMHYTGVSDPDNTLAVSFRLVCQKESVDPVIFHVHFVTRRYVEPKRMVIVWKALTEGEGRFVGFHSDETGWSVVRSNDSDDAAVMPTAMQTFVRYMPTHVRGKSCKEKDLENFATLVMESGEEDGLETARMMESLIIDDGKFR